MNQWKTLFTLTVATALVATTAFAQSDKGGNNASSPSASPSTTDKSSGAGADKSPSASPSTTDKSSSDKSSSPSAAPSGTTSDATKPSDTGMKGDKAAKSRGARMSGGNREQVKAVQQALKDKGHDPGPVDGVMGPKTSSALRDFQKKEGMKDTGRLDRDTMSKLGVEARTSGTGASDSGSASPSTSAPSGGSSSSGSAPSATGSGSGSGSDSKSGSGGSTEKK